MTETHLRWDAQKIGDQSGRHVVITGGNSGIGLQAARYLAQAGAHVVLACRNPTKAARAVETIRSHVPDAQVSYQLLDLADLGSVRAFVDAYVAQGAPLDVLINNAGVMMTPRQETADGHELQLGTNHLGHFALTLGLLPLLLASKDPRVVSVSSHMHTIGRIRFDDLQSTRRYHPVVAYAQSKLANLLFVLELQERLRAVDSPVRVTAAHPGYCNTELQQRARDRGSKIIGNAMILSARAFAQSPQMGALPTVRAAVDPTLAGGEYIGPRALWGTRGYPTVTWRAPQARDAKVAARLWDVSETMTGVAWDPSIFAESRVV